MSRSPGDSSDTFPSDYSPAARLAERDMPSLRRTVRLKPDTTC